MTVGELIFNLSIKELLITMKKFFLFALLAISATATMAQINPKPGYVITNNGDTIRGTIDFLSNKKLSRQCVFWADGESEAKTYKPGEIEGFRFTNNGKYFVTRRFELFGESQLYFAEFMVQGMMNLYCVADTYDEYFFFERDDGEMALLTNKSFMSSSSIHESDDIKQEQKEQVGRVKLLLKDSWKACHDMDDSFLSRRKLVDVVRDYHNDVCTDGGTCMVYEYKESSDKMKTHIKPFAGYAYFSHERTEAQNLPDENYHGGVLEVGLGVEVDIERVMRGGSVEFGVIYSPKTKFEHDTHVKGGIAASHTTYEKSRWTVFLGMVKRFGKGKIQPLVRGGGFYVFHRGNHETRIYQQKQIVDIDWDPTTHYGVYLGAGPDARRQSFRPAACRLVQVSAGFGQYDEVGYYR